MERGQWVEGPSRASGISTAWLHQSTGTPLLMAQVLALVPVAPETPFTSLDILPADERHLVVGTRPAGLSTRRPGAG